MWGVSVYAICFGSYVNRDCILFVVMAETS